jgi:hypothetical protein
MRNKLKTITACLSLAFTTSFSANASFFAAATEPSQITHTATNSAGWLWDAQAWLQDRATDLDKLLELVENNMLTKSIRGFNELQTAIQTDMSDVLGTLDTLTSSPTDIYNDLSSMPSSISGMTRGNQYGGLFDQFGNTFGTLGDYQGLGNTDYTGIFGRSGSSGFNSPFDLSNRVTGTRNKLASQFLGDSYRRQTMYDRWNKDTYGNDSIQMQSTQMDIMKEVVKNQNRDQEFAMMDRYQENADRLVLFEQEKARTNRVITQANQRLTDQLW